MLVEELFSTIVNTEHHHSARFQKLLILQLSVPATSESKVALGRRRLACRSALATVSIGFIVCPHDSDIMKWPTPRFWSNQAAGGWLGS